jgi:hypothetical protein
VFANFYHEKTGRETILNPQPDRAVDSLCQDFVLQTNEQHLTIWISVSRQGKSVPIENKLQLSIHE